MNMMKRTIFFLCGLLMVMNLSATDTIRLNMQAFMEDYPLDSDGKWIYTYNAGYRSLDFEDFSFSHMRADAMSEGEMSYWDGFTLCTNGDNADYGMAGSSSEWPAHQWGCMAGGGMDSTGALVKGAPYLVAYWGYNYEEEGLRSLQVDFSDGQTHRPLGIWVCSHPWAYYGIEHDDGFAHSFADNGSFFNLIAHGLDEEDKDAGEPVVFSLASFHDNKLDQPADWRWMDLSSLGQVNGVYFTLESSDDAKSLGINTAAYFCLGGMEMLAHVDEIPRPTGLEAEPLDENRVKVTWTRVRDAAYYRVYVDSVLVDSTTTNSYIFKGLQTYTSYRFYSQAVSAYGESGEWGAVRAQTKDLTAPSAVTGLQATGHTYSIDLSWSAATDNVSVSRYAVYVDGVRYARVKTTSLTITGLDTDVVYTIEVEAWDQSDNKGPRVSIKAATGSAIVPEDIASPEADKGAPKAVYDMNGRKMRPDTQLPKGAYVVQTEDNHYKKIIR